MGTAFLIEGKPNRRMSGLMAQTPLA